MSPCLAVFTDFFAVSNRAQPDAANVLASIAENDLTDEPLTANHVHDIAPHNVVRAVLKEAARQEADLLLVEARPRSFLGRVCHRSVTARLLQESPIPVLVLPAEN